MKRRNKIILAIIVILILAIGAYAGFKITQISSEPDLLEGEQNVLILGIDESEQRQGLGAVDMAFIIHLSNGTVTNYTEIYPGGMTHFEVAEPPEYQAMGAGPNLLLHDSFYWADSQKCLRLAKEIVEQNTGENITMTVGITSQALDQICAAAAPIHDENGNVITIRGIDFIREDQSANGVTRGDAVIHFAKILVKEAQDDNKKKAMIEAALDQYSKGQIVMSPEGVFEKLIASKGIEMLF